MAKRIHTTKPTRSLAQIQKEFSTEEACKRYLVKMRWGDTVACPRCGVYEGKIYALKARPFHWSCKNCSKNGYRFSVLTGTIFENTNVPLRTWFKVIYLMTQSKKGISALQVHRMIDPVHGDKGSYRTAWYMCHRIRAAMKDPHGPIGTDDIVEVDESFIGGKDRNRHKGKKSEDLRKAGKAKGYAKTEVIGAIARKGNVVARVIGTLDARTKDQFVRRMVSKRVRLVATDKDHTYNYVRRGMPHEAVNHSAGEYVRGYVHARTRSSPSGACSSAVSWAPSTT